MLKRRFERNRLFLLVVLGVPMMTTTTYNKKQNLKTPESIICSVTVNQRDMEKVLLFQRQTTDPCKVLQKFTFFFKFVDSQQKFVFINNALEIMYADTPWFTKVHLL